MQSSMNAATSTSSPAQRLERYLHDNIPLVQHMQIQVVSYDEQELVLSAPLAANINHTQTAFGGSLAALSTLACWGSLWLLLDPQADTHIVVNESHLRYLRPVTDTLVAHCKRPTAEAGPRFIDTLQRRGKARLKMTAIIEQDGETCVEFNGTFVAFRDEQR